MLSIPKIASYFIVFSFNNRVHTQQQICRQFSVIVITIGRALCPITPVDCHRVMA
jgi:hypothetical protein